jgi:hypothetical protein
MRIKMLSKIYIKRLLHPPGVHAVRWEREIFWKGREKVNT